MNAGRRSDNVPGTIDELTALYRETIVEHAVRPVGYRAEIKATHSHELYNPLCGDRIEVKLRIDGGRIEALAFGGEACAICMASASLMCAHQAGHSVAQFEEAQAWLEAALKGQADEAQIDALLPLLGVRAYPSRVRCALLPWEAAIKAITEPV